jgi:formate hydrogenlyase subunit 3/multisubunit Na+/H+ antiporter MnhD subunit
MTETGAPIGVFLLAATLGVPLAFLAACVMRSLRPQALSLQGLAAIPGLITAILVLSNGPVGLDAPALRLTLRLDIPGALMLAAAALLWLVVGIGVFANRKAAADERFAVSWLLTMTGSLGVFVAADLLSFYLVYALVSIPAYGIIVTDTQPSTARTGAIYMAFAILGETLLLLAFALLAAGEPGGGVRIDQVVAALPDSPWRNEAIALLIAGFGMKMGLVPLNGWMPLSYAAGPIPAAAVLSGAGVKAGVIGLIRFLPFGAAAPDWGAVLMTIGFVSAFYGVAIGLTQQNLRAVLAYSSISQMGMIAVALGAALASGDASGPAHVAFYAANHVLVKGALFLTIGAFAAGIGRTAGMVALAAVLALSLAGLPLTGGALAKVAAKDLLGSGLAGTLASLSSAASALLMLQFVIRLSSANPYASMKLGGERRMRYWPAVALGAILLPWLFYPAVGDFGDALSPAKVWDGLWPVLLGGAAAFGLMRLNPRLPPIPEGDTIVIAEALFHRGKALAEPFDRIESIFRQWPAASLALVAIVLALAAMAAYSG